MPNLQSSTQWRQRHANGIRRRNTVRYYIDD